MAYEMAILTKIICTYYSIHRSYSIIFQGRKKREREREREREGVISHKSQIHVKCQIIIIANENTCLKVPPLTKPVMHNDTHVKRGVIILEFSVDLIHPVTI